MCQLGSCSLYCNTVLHSCVIAYGVCTQSRAQYMCGLDSNSVGPSAKPFHSGTVLIFFYVLWNQCGTHQANHSTVEPFPNWLNPLALHSLSATLPFILITRELQHCCCCCLPYVVLARGVGETNDVSSQLGSLHPYTSILVI